MTELIEASKVYPKPVIQRRLINKDIEKKALALGLDAMAATIFASRDIPKVDDLAPWFEASLKHLDSPESMADIDKATSRLIQALVNKECIGIETDHDCDGQTSHAVMYLSLINYFNHPQALVRSYIGHRLNEGYGLSDPLVDRILADEPRPTLILTADNGSSDESRIARLKDAGIDAIVTDHHAIPEEGIPKSAYAILNPTRQDCAFPDASIAGCMVAWLWMAWTRSKMVEQGLLSNNHTSMADLLDFVAVGTVADCVSLSQSLNNRLIVKYGMKKICQFNRPCWRAIRDLVTNTITSEDIGFKIAPLLNSDGRLACAFGSVSFLLSDSDQESLKWVSQLIETNKTRKDIQKQITDMATSQALDEERKQRYTVCLYLEDGHPGVHGITASRIKEMFGKPTFIFSPKVGEEEILSGSGRSIDECHLRDALQWVADNHPNILQKFGGHKGAAGASILKKDFDLFKEAFEKAVKQQLKLRPKPIILTDGVLPLEYFEINKIKALMSQLEPFGRAFEAPLFEMSGMVLNLKWMGATQTHLRFILQTGGRNLSCVWFHARIDENDPEPIMEGDDIFIVYALQVDNFGNQERLKCLVRHVDILG